MMAFVVGVFAQTCASLLPMPDAEIEWFRDGRPFARDVPVHVSETERVYRRQHENGRLAQRTVSCTTTGSASYMTDRVQGGANVRLPLTLAVGATHSASGVTVRRIPPPTDADALPGGRWFTVSSPGVAVYGVAAGGGVVEIRTPAPSGGFSVLRAVVRDPAPAAAAEAAHAEALADAAAREQLLLDRIAVLQLTQRTLHDSIAVLNTRLDSIRTVPQSPDNVVEMIAVDVYVERGEYQTALDLLQDVMRRLRAWSETNRTRHRALDAVDARLHRVLAECAAAAAAIPRPARPTTCTLGGGDA